LVCVFLYGGNDSHNTIVSYDDPTYARYQQARGSLALSHDALTPYLLDPAIAWPDAQAFALNPALQALLPVYSSGQLAMAMRVGTLLRPVTRDDFFAQRHLPPKLMSHNDQFSEWQALLAEGAQSGWGGRIGDLLAADAGQGSSLFTAMSLNSSAVYSTGASVNEFMLGSAGPIHVGAIPGAPGSSAAIYNSLTRSSPHLIHRELARRTQVAESGAMQLDGALAGIGDFGLPDTGLGAQLNMVARLIAARDHLGMKRQTFFVSMSGFDLHSGMATNHAPLLQELGDALGAFQAAMNNAGLADSVLSFTASDFGRALTINGDGTDHGWGGHHFVMGGAVKPRQWVGAVPRCELGAPDEVGQGRMLPAISVDQLGATLATWMGVPDSDLPTVFPNINAFPTRTLDLLKA
ncbi:MAG TPA: DUF1501 domain-containing protein, partial [Ideonella sp.]|nr:DUF1501 domain-containing protein [Ideonella sp.]